MADQDLDEIIRALLILFVMAVLGYAFVVVLWTLSPVLALLFAILLIFLVVVFVRQLFD